MAAGRFAGAEDWPVDGDGAFAVVAAEGHVVDDAGGSRLPVDGRFVVRSLSMNARTGRFESGYVFPDEGDLAGEDVIGPEARRDGHGLLAG